VNNYAEKNDYNAAKKFNIAEASTQRPMNINRSR
jgi:hypothetical protein